MFLIKVPYCITLRALSTFLLLFLSVQIISLTQARPLYTFSDFDLPELDGSAVGDMCRMFPVHTPDPTTITATAATPLPITRKQEVATAKKPDVQSSPKKPETKDTGTPVRPQPAPTGPITNSRPSPADILLHYLLTNSRGRAAGSLPGFNSLMSQPFGGSTSDSAELATMVLRRIVKNRLNVGSFSAEDSSDES